MYRRPTFPVHLSGIDCYCARMLRLVNSRLPIALDRATLLALQAAITAMGNTAIRAI